MSLLDPELLERLLDEHEAALQLYAAQWTDAPEDSVQEALLKLVRQDPLPQQIVPWLYRVVRNQALSTSRSVRRRRRHERSAGHATQPWFVPSDSSRIDAQTLTEALQTLEEKHREVVIARLWGGLSFVQIASVVGISTSAAHRRYEAGLKELRRRLGVTWPIKRDPTKGTATT